MNCRLQYSISFLAVVWAVGLAASRPVIAQPAPPAFKNLEPIHADGSPAERISPIVQKVPPLDAAPPSMGYYETRWRRWDAVIMPRLPEKRPAAAVQPEPIPLPAEEADRQPPGESLPPLELPPLLPEQDGIPFLPGEPTTPPRQGQPTPAVPPGDESAPETGTEELEDLFRDPLGSDDPPRPRPAVPELVPPATDSDPFEDDDPPPVSDDLFPADPTPAAEPTPGEPPEGDVDLDDLFQIPLDDQSQSSPHLQAPARTVSTAAGSEQGVFLLREIRSTSRPGIAPVAPLSLSLAGLPPRLQNAPLPAGGDRHDEVHDNQGNPLRPAGWRPAAELIPASYIEAPEPRPVGNPLR